MSTFKEISKIYNKKKRKNTGRAIRRAFLKCPNCQRKLWPNKGHGESHYADFYYFSCPDCGEDYSAMYPKSRQHRKGFKTKLRFG